MHFFLSSTLPNLTVLLKAPAFQRQQDEGDFPTLYVVNIRRDVQLPILSAYVAPGFFWMLVNDLQLVWLSQRTERTKPNCQNLTAELLSGRQPDDKESKNSCDRNLHL